MHDDLHVCFDRLNDDSYHLHVCFDRLNDDSYHLHEGIIILALKTHHKRLLQLDVLFQLQLSVTASRDNRIDCQGHIARERERERESKWTKE